MSSDQCWRVYVKDLETLIRIGIYAAEKKPQRVIVNASIEASYSARPASISECISYEHIYNLVAREWPQREHVELLETYIVELLEYIFRLDSRIVSAKVSICKPDVFAEARSVGVEAQWTRSDYERLSGTNA